MTAISITDLNNAKLDVDHIAAVANSTALTVTDRIGNQKSTLSAAIDTIKAFNSRGAWVAATAYAGKDLASNAGSWYVCVVPHTSSAAFATDAGSKWRLYQGVTTGDLSASSGALLLGANIHQNQDNVNLEHVSVARFGAVGDGLNDCTAAIQAAINHVSATGKKLRIPAGTYKITPASAQTWEGTPLGEGTILAGLLLRSNLEIDADVGAVFKIANGVSSDAAPKRMAMFFTNEQLSDVRITGLTMDMNGANNMISPSRPATYARFQQAQILVSGTVGGVAARIDDVVIQNCSFINTPGVTCIGMAQSNSTGVTLGKRWSVLNNVFYNNGLDSDDHSSIFAWADDVVCDGNTFFNDTMHGAVGRSGSFVAYEVHGANQRFTNNLVKNYFQGMWVATNVTSAVENIIISNNHFGPIKSVAVDFYRSSAAELEIRKVIVSNNTVEIDDTVATVFPDLKVAFQIASFYKITDVLITGNIATKTGTGKASAFFSIVSQGVTGQEHDRIVVSNNQATGFVIGASVGTNATNGIGSISITGNQFYDLTPAGAFVVPVGVGTNGGASALKHLVIKGNTFSDTRSVPLFQYGIRLEGSVTNLDVSGNSFKGMTVADYYEIAFTAATRRGDYDNLFYSPVWSAGAPITIGNGTTLGPYSVKGKQVTINAKLLLGSTTIVPAGNLLVKLPVASAIPGIAYVGQWRIYDASAQTFTFGALVCDGTSQSGQLQVSGGLFATNLLPVPLASGDEISMQITYGV